MPMIVTIGSSKGGSGKTTLSILLAGELANQGHKVLLVDTDTQKSTLKWHQRCKDNNSTAENIEIAASTNNDNLSELLNNSNDKDVIIIDTAGFAANLVFELARVSDLLVLPCKISSLDAVEVLGFVNTIRSEAALNNIEIPNYKVVLNEYDPIVKGAKSFENVHKLLIENSIVVSDILLQKRERFKQVTEGIASLYQITGDDKATVNAQVNVKNLVFDLFQGDRS